MYYIYINVHSVNTYILISTNTVNIIYTYVYRYIYRKNKFKRGLTSETGNKWCTNTNMVCSSYNSAIIPSFYYSKLCTFKI